MENHPIENLMRSTMENIRDMIDVNTIIGDPIETKDGSVMIPISKVSFGFASGGSEFESKYDATQNVKFPFGGGCGAGVSVKPVAFLVAKNDTIRLLSIDHENTYDRIIDTIPQVMDMLKSLSKDKDKDKAKDKKSKNNIEETNLDDDFDSSSI